MSQKQVESTLVCLLLHIGVLQLRDSMLSSRLWVSHLHLPDSLTHVCTAAGTKHDRTNSVDFASRAHDADLHCWFRMTARLRHHRRNSSSSSSSQAVPHLAAHYGSKH